MPFLHFETSGGYDKMSQAMLEAKQEKEIGAKTHMPKEKQQPEKQTKAKVNINVKDIMQKLKERQERKKKEKSRAAERDGNESLAEEDNSASKQEGISTGDGINSPVTQGVLSSPSWERAKHQGQTYPATNPSVEQANDPAAEHSLDGNVEERRLNKPDDVRAEDFSRLEGQTDDTREPESRKIPTATRVSSGELNLSV